MARKLLFRLRRNQVLDDRDQAYDTYDHQVLYRGVKLLVTYIAKATRDVTERDLVTRSHLR